MSLIDDLRDQVQVKEAEHAAQIAEQEAQQRVYDNSLRPSMLEALDYFSELVEKLRFLDTKTPVQLPLAPDRTNKVWMEQSGYKLFYDDAKNPTRLEIYCECVLKEPQRFHISNGRAVENYTDYLDDMQFSYHRKTQLDRRYDIRSAIFELEGPLKVGIRIQANPKNGHILIYLRNLETMSTRKYDFSPEKIDTAFLERLAKLLLREESQLVRIELCPSVRHSLSVQVQSEKIDREVEFQRALEEQRLARLREIEDRKISSRLLGVTKTAWTRLFEESA